MSKCSGWASRLASWWGSWSLFSWRSTSSFSHLIQEKACLVPTQARVHLIWASNGVYIGDAYQEIDGFWVYAPDFSKGGYWDELMLRGLADWLHEKNQPWEDEVSRAFGGAPRNYNMKADGGRYS